jgi:probable rRNA maturation factor
VAVVKAVRAPVAPSFVRSVVVAAASVPEVAARADEVGSEVELTVRVTGDRELRRLNRAFLGVDAVTDVLAFPGGSGGYLGDIAVSWPAVGRQAASFGHSVEAELAVLCVHGLLHLLGWDHTSAAEERAMWDLTWRCLEAARVLGVARGRLAER